MSPPDGSPNHPSYVSGHSCNTASYATVLADAVAVHLPPQSRPRLPH